MQKGPYLTLAQVTMEGEEESEHYIVRRLRVAQGEAAAREVVQIQVIPPDMGTILGHKSCQQIEILTRYQSVLGHGPKRELLF